MKRLRLILSAVVILCLIVGCILPASAASDTTIIRQMINYYRYHQGGAETDIHRLLEELSLNSPETARRWEAIMDSWIWVNRDLDMRSGKLPDDLPDDDSLCIVVLGYQLTASGGMRKELVGRMEVALEAAKQYPNAYIMLTGGATASNNKSATEAGRMASWLISNGISEDRVIRETQAYSTEANAINCLKLMTKNYPQITSVALITSDYHMPYSYMLFAARQQLQYDGNLSMVGAACYYTGSGSSYSVATQAGAIASIAGVKIDNMNRPTLSQVSYLAVLGDTVYTPNDTLDLTATAIYDSGVFRDVTGKAQFSGYDLSKLGMQTVHVEYSENGITTYADIDILVQEEEAYVPLPSQDVPVESWETTPVEMPVEVEEEKTFSPISLLWLLVLIPIFLTAYELRERHRRIQRRRRRRRKRIRWE